MTFWACSAGAGSAAAAVPSGVAGAGSVFASAGDAVSDGAILSIFGDAGVVGVSSEARIREIGGRIVALLFNWPSFSDFFSGLSSSMSETLFTSWRGVGVCPGLAVRCGGAVAASGAAPGGRDCAGLRPAGFFDAAGFDWGVWGGARAAPGAA